LPVLYQSNLSSMQCFWGF